MDPKQLEELQERLANVFLKEIIKSLRNEEIEVEDAKTLAQEYLELEPFTSADDARSKIHSYVEKNPRFANMKTYIDSYKDEQNTNRVIDMMKKHIQNDDIDKALEVAKGDSK
jgi:hypothetical protein